jgi:hypothetical protein
MITSLPGLAILIDCWTMPRENKEFTECCSNIKKFLRTRDNIKTVVLSSYNCESEHLEAEFIWYKNNKQMCENTPLGSKIRNLRHAHDYLFMYDTTHSKEKTDPGILNYWNTSKYQISMHWWWELEYYLKLNPEIKNIYIFGQSWEGCVANRPLGYKLIAQEELDINILTVTDCVLKENASDKLDLSNDSNWVHVEDNTYLYKPTN